MERLGPDPWMELPLKNSVSPAFILQGSAFFPFGVGTKCGVKDSLEFASSGQEISSSAVSPTRYKPPFSGSASSIAVQAAPWICSFGVSVILARSLQPTLLERTSRS